MDFLKMSKSLNKYRNESIRLPYWDYSWEDLYYTTICTVKKDPLLVVIENKSIIFSDIGFIMEQEWNRSFHIRNELSWEIYTILPDHIHAIVSIYVNKNGGNRETLGGNIGTHGRAS